MQNAAFAARGLDWAYVALDVAPGELEDAVRGLAALGFAGANVTIPHKRAVADLCDELDRAAARRAPDWPPRETDATLLVHATPLVDEVLVEPRPGQTVVDLAYRPDGSDTALVAAAREAGCTVVDGLEVLVRQGAASFRTWTGVAAPLDVMRAAVRP
jgi:shikimate 5-dehydrogenase